ncbi:MAG TPA: hypothetical protein VHY22_04350 [Chthoniobacteraceae bacterium]|nr:hypothetical protein [Chthoniobacteraceae bacterium]
MATDTHPAPARQAGVPPEADSSTGMGLRSMRYRAGVLGGGFLIAATVILDAKVDSLLPHGKR